MCIWFAVYKSTFTHLNIHKWISLQGSFFFFLFLQASILGSKREKKREKEKWADSLNTWAYWGACVEGKLPYEHQSSRLDINLMLCDFLLSNSPKPSDSSLAIINAKGTQRILTFKRLESANIWHVPLKNDSNDESIIKIVGNSFSLQWLIN